LIVASGFGSLGLFTMIAGISGAVLATGNWFWRGGAGMSGRRGEGARGRMGQ
jgi:hypothetical protein